MSLRLMIVTNQRSAEEHRKQPGWATQETRV